MGERGDHHLPVRRGQGQGTAGAAPHDKIYWAYLTAMIDFANGEYNKYQNTMQMFNSFFGEFMRWFALNYRPADTHEEVYV